MKCRDIIKVLEKVAPEKIACSWDNVGLLIGRRDKNVSKILITLDVTDEVIEQAMQEQVDMIISHHPLLFKPISNVNSDTVIGRRLIRLLGSDISYYAMHTNFDCAEFGMAHVAAKKLDLTNVERLDDEQKIVEDGVEKKIGIGRVGDLEESMTLQDFCLKLKKKFAITSLAVYANEEDRLKQINRVAICPGSGKDYIYSAIEKKAQVYVTGDIGHHYGIDAKGEGIILVDAGHYRLEQIFIEYIEQYLNKQLSANVDILTAQVKNPFLII